MYSLLLRRYTHYLLSKSLHRRKYSESSIQPVDIILFLFQKDGSWISVYYITEECVQKLDTKQQTNALLTLVWRDSASEDIFTMMASICHTLMVQHRMMVPRVRSDHITYTHANKMNHLAFCATQH